LRIAAVAAISTLLMLVKLAGQSGIALPEIMFWRQAITVPTMLLGLGLVGKLDLL
jgi:hypothetical protein